MHNQHISHIDSAPYWPIVSQHPSIAHQAQKKYAEAHYLPVLVAMWQHIERVTRFRWKSTSYWRKSPSHSSGCALDIAPEITAKSASYYAVTMNSDPVLYKRETLLRLLQKATLSAPDLGYTVGVFIEPDHLHIQLFPYDPRYGNARLIKWKVLKPVYPDSAERMTLPLLP